MDTAPKCARVLASQFLSLKQPSQESGHTLEREVGPFKNVVHFPKHRYLNGFVKLLDPAVDMLGRGRGEITGAVILDRLRDRTQ